MAKAHSTQRVPRFSECVVGWGMGVGVGVQGANTATHAVDWK